MSCYSIIINTKIVNITIKYVLFILSTDQSFEIFPEHNGVAKISEHFALKLWVFFTINKQITVCSIIIQTETELFLVTIKLIKYIFPAVSVCSNACVGPLQRFKMFFSFYQHKQKSLYLLQKLLYCSQIHHL